MKAINQQQAAHLVEQSLRTYRELSPNMPEEIIIGAKELPYGWYFSIGLKNPSCGKLYYGAYTDYIVDKDYRFLHIVNGLESEQEIAYYEEKRMSFGYRLWWGLGALLKSFFLKGRLMFSNRK